MVGNDFHSLFNSYFDGKLDFSEMKSIVIENEITFLTVKKRKVIKCSEKLKKLHLFINLFVLDYLEIKNDVVFSFRKNVNVVDAVRPHSANKFIFKTDLNSFFPSINSSSVYDCISKQIENIPIKDIKEHIDRICYLVTYKNELPMGFSTSPKLSNAIFNYYDYEIQKYCYENKLTYSRYADDILISSNEYIDKEKYISILNDILKKDKKQIFHINTHKTKLIKKGKNTDVMGVKILPDGTLTVSKKIKNEVETKLYLYSKSLEEFIGYSKQDKNNAISNLSGQLNYINTVDSEYILKLKIKYGNSLVDLFFRKAI